MKNILKKAISNNLKNKLFKLKSILLDVYSTKSYSQEGEDMILQRIFENVRDGFYVDVGAHHPKRFSNTYFFYKKGWSGINIDAKPGSMALFKRIRNRDINIEAAIAKSPRQMKFFMFNEPALNSFDQELSYKNNTGVYQIIEEKNILTQTLAEVLSKHIPKGKKIHFLSIDVEGLDLEVLCSNDWEAFRPEYVLVESHGFNANEPPKNEIYRFLIEKEYSLFAKTVNTIFFKKN